MSCQIVNFTLYKSNTYIMKTNLKVTKITAEEMLLRPEQEYNPQTWKTNVERMTKYKKCQFYVVEPDEIWSYARFYVSYVCVGLYFFSDWSAYSSGITNNGFCKVKVLEDGTVEKFLFHDGEKEGYAENNMTNRQLFASRLTPIGIMVSNCI